MPIEDEMENRTAAALKKRIAVAAVLLLISSACSTLPARKTQPARPQVINMAGFRVSVPPGSGWQVTEDRKSGTVVFSKKWGGFLRWLTDEQSRIEIEVTSKQVPLEQWSMTDEELTSSIKGEYVEQISGVDPGLKWEILDRGGRRFHYLKLEEFIDGDEESTGLEGLNDEPTYKAGSVSCLYFPPDLGRTHRYFEIFLSNTRIDPIIRLHKNPERRSLEAVVDGLEIVGPFEDTPGPTGALLRAAVGGDEDALSRAINEGADVNARIPDWTVLAVAAYYGREEIVGLLAQEQNDADTIGHGAGLTPLLLALITGQPGVAALLLQEGAGVNERSEEGFSALMFAAALEQPGLTSLLIEKGADVNARTDDGKTPLMFASQSGSIESAAILLKNGAGLDIQATDGGTALILAIDWGHGGLARMLLESGADVNIRDGEGWSPLLVAIWRGDSQLVDELIGKGADVNASLSKTGETGILLALKSDQFAIARRLIESGADVNLRKPGEWTPLMAAAAKGQNGLVQLMIEKGADVNAGSDDQQTALKIAESNSQFLITGLLIRAGAKR